MAARYNNRTLRFFDVPEETYDESDPIALMIGIIYEYMDLPLEHEDVVLAMRVPRWDRDRFGPRDYVVAFRTESIRNLVYDGRNSFPDGVFLVSEELSRSSVLLWRVAVRIFGRTSVFTQDGEIYFCRDGNIYRHPPVRRRQ